MVHHFLTRLRLFDWWLNGAVLLLLTFSSAIMFSVETAAGIEGGRFFKQLIFIMIGLGVIVAVSGINYRLIGNYAYIFYGIGCVLLIAVLIVGTTIRGTTGWFTVAGFSLQPVEFAKIFFLVTFARFVSDHGFQLNHWSVIGRGILLMCFYCIPVLLQPDLGSASVIIVMSIVLLFSSTMSYRKIALVCLTGLALAVAAWFFVLVDYQKDRLLTFVNPTGDAQGSGYNVIQSIISVGSGQLVGRGLGLGPQSQLQFLPERESDFIFAVIAEELGFIGSVIIIGLYGVIMIRLWRGWQRLHDDYARALVLGFSSLVFTQMFINIGMNLGIMPVTGIPLPFVSAGGSSLIALCLGLAIVQNCLAER